jgi:hypothetical protein
MSRYCVASTSEKNRSSVFTSVARRAYSRSIGHRSQPLWTRVFAASGGSAGTKTVRKPENTYKTRKKPVETRLLLLTKASKSRKVNGGGFSRTRMNKGASQLRLRGRDAETRGIGSKQPAAARTTRNRSSQEEIRRKYTWQQH